MKTILPILLAASVAGANGAETEPLALRHLYGPDALDFSPDHPEIRWLDGGREFLRATGEGAGRSWAVVDASSGEARPLHDAEALARALVAEADLSPAEAAEAARPDDLRLSPGGDRILLDLVSDLFVWNIAESRLERLTRTPEREEIARFSPDGRRVAFVREHDLFVVDADGAELRLTTSGGPDTLNGKLDWVYQEEIYGRGDFRAHWWSPDGRRLAFLQSDEREAPRFTIVDHLPYRPGLEVYPYPKAGDPNPRVRLGVAGAAGGGIGFV